MVKPRKKRQGRVSTAKVHLRYMQTANGEDFAIPKLPDSLLVWDMPGARTLGGYFDASVIPAAARKAAAISLTAMLGTFAVAPSIAVADNEPSGTGTSSEAGIKSFDPFPNGAPNPEASSQGASNGNSASKGTTNDSVSKGTSDDVSEDTPGSTSSESASGTDSFNGATGLNPFPEDATNPDALPEGKAIEVNEVASSEEAAALYVAADSEEVAPEEATSFAETVNAQLETSASESVEITLSDETTVLSEAIIVPAGKTLTINLNGKTLDASSASGGAFRLYGGSALNAIDIPVNARGEGTNLSGESNPTTGDASEKKAGLLTTTGTLFDMPDFEQCVITMQKVTVSCKSLVDESGYHEGSGCFIARLTSCSLSMASRTEVLNQSLVDIQGGRTASSASDSMFYLQGGGSVKVGGGANIAYNGMGAVFDIGQGGVLAVGSKRSSNSATIKASNGSIVRFGSSSTNMLSFLDGVTFSCGKEMFVAADDRIKPSSLEFGNVTLPDSSVKSFLSEGSFCVYESDKAFVVKDQTYINGCCVGVADGVYYASEKTSEAEGAFKNAPEPKTPFHLVSFSFEGDNFEGGVPDGASAHVKQGTKLGDIPGVDLPTATPQEGYSFIWTTKDKDGTEVSYTPDELSNLPVTERCDYVGKCVFDDPDPTPGPGGDTPVNPDDPDKPPVDPDTPGGGSGTGEGNGDDSHGDVSGGGSDEGGNGGGGSNDGNSSGDSESSGPGGNTGAGGSGTGTEIQGNGNSASSGPGGSEPTLPSDPSHPMSPNAPAGYTLPGFREGLTKEGSGEGMDPLLSGSAGPDGDTGAEKDGVASEIDKAVEAFLNANATSGSAFDAKPDEGSGVWPAVAEVAIPLSLAGATALAAFIMARAAGFSAANAEAAKKAKRARKRGHGPRPKRAKAGA